MKIQKCFRLSQPELKEALRKELKSIGYSPVSKSGFLYAEGDVPVLLVAHLDTVHKTKVVDICVSDNGIMMSPQGIGGDDRCGVYMITQIVKKHKCHVLFCEDEEIGGVGAECFARSGIAPEVNFIVEMDRAGNNDAVFYDCDNPEFTDFVCGFGFKEEMGSFSDISIIAPALGVAAVNLSSGYHNPHTIHEYVCTDEVEANIDRICDMVSDSEDKAFEYVESERYAWDRYLYDDRLYGYPKTTSKSAFEQDIRILMPLSEDVHYVSSSWGNEYCGEGFLIDEGGAVYELDYDSYACYPLRGYKAYEYGSKPARFVEAKSDLYEVISIDEYDTDYVECSICGEYVEADYVDVIDGRLVCDECAYALWGSPKEVAI